MKIGTKLGRTHQFRRELDDKICFEMFSHTYIRLFTQVLEK